MTDTLTSSRKLTLDQHYYSLTEVYSINDALDEKAMGMMQLSTLVIALVLILMPQSIDALLVVVPYIFTLGSLTYTLFPKDTYTPGSSNWDKIYDEYIHNEGYFDKILSDVTEAMDRVSKVNKIKAKSVKMSMLFFSIQMIGLFLYGS